MVCTRATAHRSRHTLVTLVALWIGTLPAQASTILPSNVEELIGGSERIIVATVLSSKPEASRNGVPPSIVTTVRVEETLKGPQAKEIQFRQLGRMGPGRRIELFPGLPKFSDGERVVLMLPQPSSIGFASPFALGQGTFRMQDSGRGKEAVLFNESRNRTLFRNLKSLRMTNVARTLQSTSLDPKSEVPLRVSDLKALIGSTPTVTK